MTIDSILKSDERAIFTLRSIYKQYGYMPYKMSKFEEYDLYLKNKDFLLSDRIITFNDTNGKLLALKPDVTLSIIKNANEESGSKQKVYYNENVYRVSESSHQYKEIMQTGVECIGDIGTYDIYETVLLAAKSLEAIGGDFVLDISNLDILTAALDGANSDSSFKAAAVKCIKEKNEHDLRRLCGEFGVSDKDTERLAVFASLSGRLSEVIPELEKYLGSDASDSLGELKALCSLLYASGYADKINFDFSVINDINYYSGVVFRGFIDGISGCVLSGGRYDKLLKRMGRNLGAVGFAIYLDLIESIGERSAFDVDVLLLYDENTDISSLSRAVNSYISSGKSVSAQKAIPEKLRYRELISLISEVAK